jgi:hypothetical protein
MADRLMVARRFLTAGAIALTAIHPVEAQQYDVSSLVASVEAAVKLATKNPANARLDSSFRAARVALGSDPDAMQLRLDDIAALIARSKPSLGVVGRWNPSLIAYTSRSEFRTALLDLVRVGNTALARIDTTVAPRDSINALEAPLDQLQTLVLHKSQQVLAEKLRRYELKYGPGAPALNAAEVVLNLGTQWLPTFGPNSDGWVGPNEFILAYRAMQGATSVRGDSASLLSSGQFGVRHYFWDKGARTENDFLRFVKPGNASGGLMITSSSDKALVRPWGRGNRLGAFLGYGDIHAAYVWDKPRRLLIGSGKQFIPYAF